jgi:hypothetical protein
MKEIENAEDGNYPDQKNDPAPPTAGDGADGRQHDL